MGNYRTGTLARVDPKTHRIRRVAVGGAPFDVLVARGSVWVTGFDNGSLVEVDAREVTCIAAGGRECRFVMSPWYRLDAHIVKLKQRLGPVR